MSQPTNKLARVCVSELLVQRVVYGENRNGTPLLTKIRNTKPSTRGRGHSRVIENLSNSDWNELYQLAVYGREQTSGGDRSTNLGATLSAKNLAQRMETLGVDNPVPYAAKRTRKASTVQTETTDVVSETQDEISEESEVSEETVETSEAA